LSGIVPNSILNLTNIKWLRLNNNLFTSIPDFTSLSYLQHLKLENNKLSFEDLEPNMPLASLQEYTYSPQDSVNQYDDTLVAANSLLTLKTSIGGTQNQYQWYLNNTQITGATDSIYSITQVTPSDTGIYTCRITNSIVTGLTLWRKTIHVYTDTLQNMLTSNQQGNIHLWIQNHVLYVKSNKPFSVNTVISVYLTDGKQLCSSVIASGKNETTINLPANAGSLLLIKIITGTQCVSKKLINL